MMCTGICQWKAFELQPTYTRHFHEIQKDILEKNDVPGDSFDAASNFLGVHSGSQAETRKTYALKIF